MASPTRVSAAFSLVGMPMAWVRVTMAVRERRSWKRILGGLLVFELGCCEVMLLSEMDVM